MGQKISLTDALEIINQITDKPFKTLFDDEVLFKENVLNKGSSGQLGLDLTSDLLDFSDGELKSVIWRERNFSPNDTMAITMVNSEIDNFLSDMPYVDSHVYQKIKNFILLPTVKKRVSTEQTWPIQDWYYSHPYHVSVDIPKYQDFYSQLKEDYYSIRTQVIDKLDSGGCLETTNGKYLQIRTKGSGKNTVCFSKIYNRNINSDGAAYAFYLKKDGLKQIQKINS